LRLANHHFRSVCSVRPTDVAGTPGCNAYCAKMQSACSKTCVPSKDCKIESGQCASSQEKFLNCEATTGQWYCGADGFSVVHDCDFSACP
jgi:hypothetical protein